MTSFLNIVDENDQIIGQETREKIHREGLLHREVYIYFVTPNREIIFQHRAKDKDLFPDLLDVAVGGHVEIEQSYEEAAIREAKEETGLEINKDDLVFISKTQRQTVDKATGKINNAIKFRYLYIFSGELKNLQIEEGKALGFEAWSLDKLSNLSPAEKDRFIPYILEFVNTQLAEVIKKYL